MMGLLRSGGGVTYYVDSVNGNDSNTGLAAGAGNALRTPAAAVTKIGTGIGTVKITAPSSTPAEGFFTITQGTITFEGLNGVTWYMERAQTFTSGWTDAGGGVYSRTASNASRIYVATLSGANVILLPNTGTPTTPSAGQFGSSGGTLYVHLPGDANANSNTIKRPSTTYLTTISGGNVTFKNMVARFADDGVIITVTGGTVTVQDSTLEYGAGSGISSANASTVNCTNVISRYMGNDGFSANNTSTMRLTSCTGSFNGDEGASPHNTSTMYIVGGTFANNNSSGVTVAGGTCHISGGAVFEANNQSPPSGETLFGGITYSAGSSGSINTVTTQNNLGPGLYCLAGAGAVTVTALTSTGNGSADTACP